MLHPSAQAALQAAGIQHAPRGHSYHHPSNNQHYGTRGHSPARYGSGRATGLHGASPASPSPALRAWSALTGIGAPSPSRREPQHFMNSRGPELPSSLMAAQRTTTTPVHVRPLTPSAPASSEDKVPAPASPASTPSKSPKKTERYPLPPPAAVALEEQARLHAASTQS